MNSSFTIVVASFDDAAASSLDTIYWFQDGYILIFKNDCASSVMLDSLNISQTDALLSNYYYE